MTTPLLTDHRDILDHAAEAAAPFVGRGRVADDRLIELFGDASTALRDFLREQSGNPAIDVDPLVAASEAERGNRNAAVCVWSPCLDEHGNSQAGAAALERFTTVTGWSVF